MGIYSASPNGKINLGLIIKGKRDDGYHLLETVLYPVFEMQDKLEISESSGEASMEIKGIAIEGKVSENLCLKAYQILKSTFPDLPPVNIYLEKNIPAGAGLGGGSSDAAFTLKGLNTLFRLGLTEKSLAEMGAALGADVPFFIYNKPLLASGIGTEFAPIYLALEEYHIKIVTPAIHSATAAAYKALDYTQCNPMRNLREILSHPVSQWQNLLENDLEVPVFQRYPALATLKESLLKEGAMYAAMSGSGSAVFGLFRK